MMGREGKKMALVNEAMYGADLALQIFRLGAIGGDFAAITSLHYCHQSANARLEAVSRF